MKLSRLVAAGASALLVTGFGIGFAAPASANQVWTQQVQRASADAPCDIPAVEGEAAGWSAWAPSWAQWPNGGEGGWVCTRSITWAKDTPPPGMMSSGGGSAYASVGCVQGSPSEWVDFLGGWALPEGSPDYLEDPTCTTSNGPILWDIVYVPDGADPSTLCIEAWGTDEDLTNFGYPVWGCKLYTT